MTVHDQLSHARRAEPLRAAPSTGLAGLPVAVQVATALYVGGRARTLVRG